MPYAPDGTVNHIATSWDSPPSVRRGEGASGARRWDARQRGQDYDVCDDVRRRMDFRVVRDEFFGSARSGFDDGRGQLPVAPDYLIEIEAVAIL